MQHAHAHVSGSAGGWIKSSSERTYIADLNYFLLERGSELGCIGCRPRSASLSYTQGELTSCPYTRVTGRYTT